MMCGVSRMAFGVVTVVLAGIAGCGDSSSDVPSSASTSSTTEATVSGTVTINGKAATDGEVVFNPANVNRKVGDRRAKIGPDGHYEIKTLVGMNSVTVAGSKAVKDNPKAGYISKSFDVKEGANSFDITAP
jgi:hypothetical protein